ncbi:uncharacterized protein LOC119634165 isoform X3 [Glossina fuscipes]|uniref:Uncharacterized protein LOC119634165 isoform X3 n=1 Tax=Glossina fuscipes TaxID=7396 RepID=A0A8U0WGR5_9MUSC|nr:uncharacterized protein LOC119634165 isoform X3 [Glossina fuscipes]
MEAKLLAISFLSIFLAIYAQSLANIVEDSTEFEFETAIYYGDSSVNLGEPFSITCIIPVTDPIIWLKDDEPITRHNLRHGRDEHSYILSESAIEGEKHKIEAHISVRHALKVHEGRYQCNDLHTSYHMLYVNIPPPEAPKLQTKSPFVIHAPAGSGDANVVRHLSTEPIYETVHDLTPSNSDESLGEIFTRTWEPVDPGTPSQILPLPTQATMTTAILTQQQQQQHHRTHHHHHQLPTSQQLDRDDKHKLIYINATNFDGIPRPIDERRFDKSSGLINLQFNPAMDTRYTTEPWKGSTIYYAATPPNIPPPRTTALVIANIEHPQGQQYAGGIYPYKPNVVDSRHKSHDIHHTTALGEGAIKSQYPIQTVQAPPYYQYPTQQQLNTMVTFPARTPPPQPAQHQPTMSIYQNPFLQYNQMPPGHMQPIQPIQPIQPNYMTLPPGERVVATTAPIFASSTSYGLLPTSHTPPLMISNNMNNNNSNVNLLLTQTKSKERDFLVPNYDNAEHQLKVYDIRNPLVLSCNITKEGSYELKWEKNNTDVSKVKELEGRYRILAAERKFIIDKTDLHDDGPYSCVADNQKRDFNVVAQVVVRVPSNVGVVEGEKLSIVCTVVGTDPKLSWSFGNMTISNSTDRYILKPNDDKIENAVLSMENVSLNDRGEFKCIARNAATEYANFQEASDVSFVRVKGKLAALWPFLGICAEVLIMCAIILIYEKRRNKTELEESDTDPQEH